MYEEHPILAPPGDENERIWRYMDFTKFISILDKKALFFTRSDKFDDRFEGSYSKFNIENRPNVYKGDGPEKLLESIPKFAKDARKWVFINCWHLNHHESAAMWNMYSKANESVAIQSTYKRLKESFNINQKEIYIGKVNYADYETDWIPEGNVLYPFIYKRKSFEHEKELRAIYLEMPPGKDGRIELGQNVFDDGIDGIYIDIDINKLIDTVYISPLADEWFSDLVRSITRKYDYDFDVRKSDLGSNPVY